MSKTKLGGNPPRTLVTFLLDRSGSMTSILDSTIEAFNAYRDGLVGGPIDFSLVTFDSGGLDKICVEAPVETSPRLNKENFVPRASTPLIDAAFKTIKAVEESVGRKKEQPKVIVAIQTDGQENCSTEHTWAELNALIKEKIAAGWHFIFMGASIDAYDQGTRMGIGIGNTVSYNAQDRGATMSAFTASATNVRGFAGGMRTDVQYSKLQKGASGDRFEPDLKPAKTVLPVNPPPPKAKPIVDDFKL